MICGNALYSTLYHKVADNTARRTEKKSPKAYGAELFLEKEEEEGKKRGKQSVLDDAKTAGKDIGASQPKTETESRIVVKPDGSKVLVITVRCGQSVRVKSLKISEPTDMGDAGKQEGVSAQEEAVPGQEGGAFDLAGEAV